MLTEKSGEKNIIRVYPFAGLTGELTSDAAAIVRFLFIGVDVRCCSVLICFSLLLSSLSSGNRWSINCSVVCVGDLMPKNPPEVGTDDCMPITFCTLVAPWLCSQASPYSFPETTKIDPKSVHVATGRKLGALTQLFDLLFRFEMLGTGCRQRGFRWFLFRLHLHDFHVFGAIVIGDNCRSNANFP